MKILQTIISGLFILSMVYLVIYAVFFEEIADSKQTSLSPRDTIQEWIFGRGD